MDAETFLKLIFGTFLYVKLLLPEPVRKKLQEPEPVKRGPVPALVRLRTRQEVKFDLSSYFILFSFILIF